MNDKQKFKYPTTDAEFLLDLALCVTEQERKDYINDWLHHIFCATLFFNPVGQRGMIKLGPARLRMLEKMQALAIQKTYADGWRQALKWAIFGKPKKHFLCDFDMNRIERTRE